MYYSEIDKKEIQLLTDFLNFIPNLDLIKTCIIFFITPVNVFFNLISIFYYEMWESAVYALVKLFLRNFYVFFLVKFCEIENTPFPFYRDLNTPILQNGRQLLALQPLQPMDLGPRRTRHRSPRRCPKTRLHSKLPKSHDPPNKFHPRNR